MRHARSATITGTICGVAANLVLAACSNSSPAAHSASSVQATQRQATGSPIATPRAPASVAASHTSSPPKSVTVVAACSLITEQDVATAAGTDPGPGAANSHQGDTACAYGSYPKQVLTVNVVPIRGRAGYARLRRDPHLASGTGRSVAHVPDLGDQAFELSGAHTDAIYFTKGDALVVIGVSGPSAPTKGAALALAKIAAGHL